MITKLNPNKIVTKLTFQDYYKIIFISYIILVFFIVKDLYSQENNRGVSWIGQMCSAKSNCNDIKSAYTNSSVLNAGWLYSTFNDKGCKCSEGFLKDSRPKNIRVHLCNSTCFPERGRKCQPYECFAGESIKSADAKIRKKDPKIIGRLIKVAGMAKRDIEKGVNIKSFSVSPCLECNFSKEARKILLDVVAPMFPDAELVDNPLTDSCIPGYICEKHSDKDVGANEIVDLDGKDYDTIDSYSWAKKNTDAKLVLAWKLCNNGIPKCEKGQTCGFIPPQNRSNYCGTSRDGKDFAYFTADNALQIRSPLKDEDKKGCKKFIKTQDGTKKGFTWKLGDGRTYAVTLFPTNFKKRFNKIEARKDGKTFDTPKYRGQYSEDRSNRLIYDWRKHTSSFPDNTVINADGNCFVLEKPGFRID